jgi:hypothetical protein
MSKGVPRRIWAECGMRNAESRRQEADCRLKVAGREENGCRQSGGGGALRTVSSGENLPHNEGNVECGVRKGGNAE